MRQSQVVMLLVLVAALTGCGGGYWTTRGAAFDVRAGCDRCAPVTGIIQSDQVNGPIEPRLYELSDAMVRAASGDRLRAAWVCFDGASGAFETPDVRGYLLADRIVLYCKQGPMSISAQEARSDERRGRFVDAELARGVTAVRAHLVQVFWDK